MTVETLLGFWDGFGDIAIYERGYDGPSQSFYSYNKESFYTQLIEKYGKREVRFFGVAPYEKGLLEIFLI